MEKIALADAKSSGKTRYFTGLPCANGHIAERLVSSRSCCECIRIRLAAYRVNNRESLLQKKREYAKQQRITSPEHVYSIAKKSVAKHRVARNEEKADWAKRNSGRVLAWCRKRQLAKKQRTPQWLTQDDHWLIEQAYELAALRSKMFGFPWHVDHVIPLNGKTVSGLHVPSNLQVIPGSENSRKGNRI
jgi:hypothetical protein